jgi:chromosome segregation ATPase
VDAALDEQYREEDAAGAVLEGEALERFLRAQLAAARKEVVRLAASLDAVTKRAEAAEGQAKQLAVAVKELQGASGMATAAAERAEKARASAAARCEALEIEAAALRSKADTGVKAARAASKTAETTEERLHAAAEEIAALRAEVARGAEAEADRARTRDMADRLERENRSLERQRADLVAAFRAQAKLVDVLKRQKAHLESAKLLEISEQEFMRVLSLPGSGDV